MNRKYRRIISQFRISAHDLEVERNRYSGIGRCDRCDRSCVAEKSKVINYHFVLICIMFKDLRHKYIPVYYRLSPYIYKFNRLMSARDEQTILNLALYLYHATDRRKRYLQQANKSDNLYIINTSTYMLHYSMCILLCYGPVA